MVKVCFSSALETQKHVDCGERTGEVSQRSGSCGTTEVAGDNEPVLAAGMRFLSEDKSYTWSSNDLDMEQDIREDKDQCCRTVCSNSAWTSKDIDSSS